MLYILLADSAIEIIPRKLYNIKSVGQNVKKYGEAGKILDISLHHYAMKSLKQHTARGRPDIVHHFLIDTLSSLLNKWDKLRLYIHTRDFSDNPSRIFEINPHMRPPKEYLRFKGVLFKLLTENVIKIPKDTEIIKNTFIDLKKIEKKGKEAQLFTEPLNVISNPDSGPPKEFLLPEHWDEYGESFVLARKIKKKLANFIKYLNPDVILRFQSNGKLIPQTQLFTPEDREKNVLVIIGGFQSGSFSPQVGQISAKDVSIFPKNLESWSVVQRVLINYENLFI